MNEKIASWDEYYEQTYIRINFHISLLDTIFSVRKNCPKSIQEGIVPDAEKFVFLFIRAAKRALFFAKKFLSNMHEELKSFLSNINLDSPDGVIVASAIDDSIYFYFDAFIMAGRSMLDSSLNKRIKYLHKDMQNEFNQFCKNTYINFIENILKPVRDEVVHLNEWGSSIGSACYAKIIKKKVAIKIPCSFTKTNGEEYDLIELLDKILSNFFLIIEEIYKLFMKHFVYTYGYPKKVDPIKVGEFLVDIKKYLPQ